MRGQLAYMAKIGKRHCCQNEQMLSTPKFPNLEFEHTWSKAVCPDGSASFNVHMCMIFSGILAIGI